MPSRIAFLLALVLAAAPARAAMSIYVTPEELAGRATRIVEGRVAAVRVGYDKATGGLATYVTLDVAVTHRGPDAVTNLTLRVPGGSFGNLTHEVDAVPVYREGEEVFVFLEPAPDGALRTSGMFYGKFVLDRKTATATRELDGQGRILHRPTSRGERVKTGDLVALAAAPAPFVNPGRDTPPELGRMTFEDGRATPEKFVALSASHPTRWDEVDSGIPIAFDVERARNPLGSGPAAVAEILRAMAAWTAVPESRVDVVAGDDDAAFTPAHPTSPAVAPPSEGNIVLFGDPYDDIANSGGCSGILAVGGYWRSSSPSSSVNGVTFYPARHGYVIFNDGLECFLGNPDNLAEIATHELGHALGFGHSGVADAIMRSTAYGGRGPRLGDDDRDAAHCHYPHTIVLDAPAPGALLEAGTTTSIRWSSSGESGPDPGTVDLELQRDGGAWELLAFRTPNDGIHSWTVPGPATSEARVRVVRPNRAAGQPAAYPPACSASPSAGAFSIAGAAADPGELVPAEGLFVDRSGGTLRLLWGVSCSGEADDYAVYAADLDALRAGRFNPQPLACSTGGGRLRELLPPTGNRYYLVAPLAAGREGGLGRGSGGPRNPAGQRCGTEVVAASCEP